MIDLSHLTEEEQGMIMAVLKRDVELKKAEEERIGKLQKILSSSSRSETKLKHLTGEWFYEAKSRRHTDKIHGSEIILASMAQRKASDSDGSLRLRRSGTSSGRGSDIVAPPKPARLLVTSQPQDMSDAETEKLKSALRSPVMPRHNPFDRASLIHVEPPEKTEELLTNGDGESLKTSETEPFKNHAGQVTQTSGGSVTSDGSSIGFRPVPKKRTFLSRRTSTLSGNNSVSDTASKVIVPAPRLSLRHCSSATSNQSSLRGIEEISQKTTVTTSFVSPSGQPPNSPNEVSQQSLSDASKVSPDVGLERTKERVVPKKCGERDDLPYRGYAGVHTTSIQGSERGKDSNVGIAMTLEEHSLAQSSNSVENQPIRYDLNFIDTPTQHSPKKSNQAHVSKLSPHTPSPTGDEGDSIAKVLEWFSRSTDSHDLLNTKDSQQPINSFHSLHIRIKDSLTKDAENISENRRRDKKKDAAEIKRDQLQRETNEAKDMDHIKLRATDGLENKEVTEMQEEVRKDTGEQMRVNKVKENVDESQPHKISHLKSFWEKSNIGPKILVSRPNTTSGLADETQSVEKSVQNSMKKEKEGNDNKPHTLSEMSSAPGLYSVNPKDEREQKQTLSVSPQKDIRGNESVVLNGTCNQQADHIANKDTSHTPVPEMHTSTTHLGKQQSPGTQRKEDQKYNADYLILPTDPQVVDRRGSDTEVIALTRLSPQTRTHFQPRLCPESERFSPLRLSPQPDSLHQSRDQSLITTPQQEERSRASTTTSEFDTNLQSKDSSDSEMLYQSRNSPYMDDQRGGNDIQVTQETQMQRDSSDDVKSKDSEDRSVQSSMSPKKKEDSTYKDRSNSPCSQRQGPKHQESTAERIKQLKAFWEQEKNKPMFYTGKPKGLGDGKATRGANLGKLNKRFTKSEYDLTSLGNDSGSDVEDHHQNFTILSMNQRQDNLSPNLGANRAQFNNLREFWGEATHRRGSLSSDKPIIPKKKEQIDAQSPAPEIKCVDPEFHRKPTTVDKTTGRPVVNKSPPPSQSRSKSPHDRQSGPGAENDNLSHYVTVHYIELDQQRDPRRASRDSTRKEKTLGKETRAPKIKKDNFGNSNGRGSSMRRAKSMFSLNVPEEQDQPLLGQFKKTQEDSPVPSQSRKQSSDRTQSRKQSADKGATSRKPSEDSEPLTPRARAFVPRDYRHYLGMTEKTSIHTTLAPTLKEQGAEGEPGYDLDLSEPVTASTPVGSEERYSRKGSKISQRPPWENYSSSDTGPASSVSSTSETWSNSRNNSNRENDDGDQNPVKRALRRAEARPKYLAKSLEDITASSTARQERRQDPIADLRRSSDDRSIIPSPSPSLFSDPEHLKNMSKSVPSFLREEGHGRDTDSASEDSYRRGRQKMGPSMTNLTNSSGMASVSSLSGSVTTVYSGDFGNVEIQGNIQFSINYVQKLREFHIFVAQCQDLAAVDPKRGRSDPYVKSYLVPDKANLGKRKTSVKKKTLNPTFNEILRYRVRMEYLRTQMLILSVWHHDTFGRNSFLGEIDVDLSRWNFDHTQMNYLALKARTTPTPVPNDRGEIKLAIRFLPQITRNEGTAKEGPNAGEVHIWVKECKNLPLIRASIDPYVKCFVLPDTSRKSRQKTRVLRRTVDPVFNHTMVYDGIRAEDLAEVCAELTVWDRDRLASSLLGGLRLGPGTGRSYGAVVHWMDSTPYEVAMWERMMAAPNEWVEDVIPLRVLTSAKTALK